MESVVQRYRLRFGRDEGLRLLTHREQIDLFRKLLKETGLPIVRKGKKGNKVKIAFGPAISVGYESESEYCDIGLYKNVVLESVKEKVISVLPAGLHLISVKRIPVLFPSLEEILNLSEFRISLPNDETLMRDIGLKIDVFMKKQHFNVTKVKKDKEEVIDARDLVLSLKPEEGGIITMMLRFGPRKNLKPEKILTAALDIKEEAVGEMRICRKKLFYEKKDGSLMEP